MWVFRAWIMNICEMGSKKVRAPSGKARERAEQRSRWERK